MLASLLGKGSVSLFARFAILKIGDLYRQQLRVHGWKFWNGSLLENRAAMLSRKGDVHGYGTRSARGGIHVGTRDHRSVGFRVPGEWALLPEGERRVGNLGAFKRGSRAGFLRDYGAFVCGVRECGVCSWPGVDRTVLAPASNAVVVSLDASGIF